jgi:hypothetical protein
MAIPDNETTVFLNSADLEAPWKVSVIRWCPLLYDNNQEIFLFIVQ